MKNNALVTVVVPVYNVKDYLIKCTESILNQSHKNLEIILADDGSQDGSAELCDHFANTDKRVKVIHKSNGGLSDARNAGVKDARGDFIAFIDGDDYVHRDYVSVLLEAAQSSQAEIVVCGYYVVNEKNKLIPYMPQPAELDSIKAVKDLLVRPSVYKIVTWNKLYKTDLFKGSGISFPFGKIHEDNFTTYKLFYYANKISYIDVPLYYYVQRANSIMNRKFNQKRLDVMGMFAEAEQFFALQNLDVREELRAHKLSILIGLYNDYLFSRSEDEVINRILRTELGRQRKIIFSRHVSGIHKLLYVLAIGNRFTYIALRGILDACGRKRGKV